MEIVDTIVALWPFYGIAAAALIWYAVSEARRRSARSVDEWEAMMVDRESDDDPIPDVPKHEIWDVYVSYWAGAILGIAAFVCAAFKLMELLVFSLLGG